VIEVTNLTYRYPNAERLAVEEVSFEVRPGTIFGFLGPSGAGKSTVQKLMTGLLPRPRGEGAIRYDGAPRDPSDRSFFRRIGVSFEHPNVFPKLTGRENLACFAALHGKRDVDPDALLERLGLGAHADKLAGEYSKGMKQRLVFGRAILHRPDFLFLDEPTSGLDPGTIEVVLAIIAEEKARGARVLLTTHDMSVVERVCDEVAFLVDGKIAARGTPRQLALSHGERRVVVERRKGDALVEESFRLDREDERRALARAIEAHDVETVHSKEATLAEIFVRLTGRGLAS